MGTMEEVGVTGERGEGVTAVLVLGKGDGEEWCRG
jgi:hypothetical protein